MAPIRRQAIIWINVDPVQRSIYAALGGDELTTKGIYVTYLDRDSMADPLYIKFTNMGKSRTYISDAFRTLDKPIIVPALLAITIFDFP